MAVHSGTHMDAPLHFLRDKWSVDEIPITHFMNRPLVVVDVANKVSKNRDYEVLEEDLLAWEMENGEIPEGAVILIRTGYSKFYKNRAQYMGTATNLIQNLHYPGIGPEAALWIVKNRLVVGVGIDALSIDPGAGLGFLAHRTLLERNLYLLENINSNIDKLPATGAFISVFPLPLQGASGSPCRVIVDLNASHLIQPLGILSIVAFFLFTQLFTSSFFHHILE